MLYSNGEMDFSKVRFPLIFGTFLISGYIWQKNFYTSNRQQILEERDQKLNVSRSADANSEKKSLENLKR